MKKAAIRKAVNKAVDKHISKAIDDVARSKAFGAVYDAMAPEPDADDAPMAAPVAATPARPMSPADCMARMGRK